MVRLHLRVRVDSHPSTLVGSNMHKGGFLPNNKVEILLLDPCLWIEVGTFLHNNKSKVLLQ